MFKWINKYWKKTTEDKFVNMKNELDNIKNITDAKQFAEAKEIFDKISYITIRMDGSQVYCSSSCKPGSIIQFASIITLLKNDLALLVLSSLVEQDMKMLLTEQYIKNEIVVKPSDVFKGVDGG